MTPETSTSRTNVPAPRHSHWFMVAAFSTIALVAMTSSSIATDLEHEDNETKWAVSAVSVTVAFSSLAVFANVLLKEKFAGTPVEGGLAVFTFGFWAAVLPAIMDPDNNLAISSSSNSSSTTNRGGAIDNHNLYFFSWGAFVVSFMVLFGYTNDMMCGSRSTTSNCHHHHHHHHDATNNYMFAWAGLVLTSFVVMIAASRQFDDFQCDDNDTNVGFDNNSNNSTINRNAFCDRTTFAVSIGAVSALISLVWLIVSSKCVVRMGRMAFRLMNAALAWLMMALWVFGIIYITFDDDDDEDKAPARELGNLYFFTWGSFCVCVTMAMTSLQSLLTAGNGDDEEAPKEAAANADDTNPKNEHADHNKIEADHTEANADPNDMDEVAV